MRTRCRLPCLPSMMHFAKTLKQFTEDPLLTLQEAVTALFSRTDSAKARALILEKPARWMASGSHFFHAPCPFTLPTFSVGIMLSCLMARPDALNLLAFTTCCMVRREIFPLVVIFGLGFRSLCVLSRCLGSNAKISAALVDAAPFPGRRPFSLLPCLVEDRFRFRLHLLGTNAKRALQSMNNQCENS